MGREVERKYLVTDPDWKAAARPARSTHIEQGYLCADKQRSVRVRIEQDRATLTIKGATKGITRDEFEYPLPLPDAKRLLDLCGRRRVSKRRFAVEYGGKAWVVDEFHGRNEGLVIAEVELRDASDAIDKPAWAGVEVSDRPEYYNSNLARKPVSEWGRRPND